MTVLEGILAETKKTQYTDQERGQRMQTLETLGRMQRGAGKTSEAIASFRQIVELNPALASRIDVEIIDTLSSGTISKQRVRLPMRLSKSIPATVWSYCEHAFLLSEMGQYDAAISELKAMSDSAKDRDLLIQIAQIQDKAKRFDDERKTLESAEALFQRLRKSRGFLFCAEPCSSAKRISMPPSSSSARYLTPIRKCRCSQLSRLHVRRSRGAPR